jgi:hypothetical protein
MNSVPMSSPATPELLVELLARTVLLAGNGFTGIGVIVTQDASSLPIMSLRGETELPGPEETARKLADISHYDNEFHDGFHILDVALGLVRVAQYFSPPIVPEIELDRSRRFGGRYVAALFGSALPGVVLTGIASRDFGIGVFNHGAEYIFQAPR